MTDDGTIELTGAPILEGRDGFFSAYLNFISMVLRASSNPENFENSKASVVALVKIGIAMIPDPDNTIRSAIYDKIYDDIDEQWLEEEKREGKKLDRRDVNKQRQFAFNAYVDVGIGELSTWMDQMVGIVVRNRVGRTYALGYETAIQ